MRDLQIHGFELYIDALHIDPGDRRHVRKLVSEPSSDIWNLVLVLCRKTKLKTWQRSFGYLPVKSVEIVF